MDGARPAAYGPGRSRCLNHMCGRMPEGGVNMDPISQAVADLLGRASGPMHFRLVLQPLVASVLAVRAGLRDAKAGQPPYFWALVTDAEHRRQFLASGWKDVSKVFVLALVLDTAYQLIVMHEFHVVQTLVVAVGVALLPYVILRGPVNRIAQGSAGKR
jgi:hypothetical protein